MCLSILHIGDSYEPVTVDLCIYIYKHIGVDLGITTYLHGRHAIRTKGICVCIHIYV